MNNILVTNDDGIDATGIQRLIATLAHRAQVYVFAPKTQQSAKGQSMTAFRAMAVEERHIDGTVEAWTVDGTPTDCVKYGVQSMTERGIPVDYVISGINMGLNLGADVHYSGTVSAAMEGALSGIHSIALSVEHHQPDYYDYICQMLPEVIRLAEQQDPATVLNVNTPDCPACKIRGTKITKLGPKRFFDRLDRDEAEENSNSYRYSGGSYPIDENLGEDVDVVANMEKFATITPINVDYTDLKSYHALQGLTNSDMLCLFIDFQEKLVPVMRKPENLMKNTVKWARCAEALDLPILMSQQYTRGLGATVPELRKAVREYQKLEKITFSCFDAPGFREEMAAMTGRSVVIAGIETHICVYQTAMDYLAQGFQVTILSDCCSARKKADHESALRELEKAGCRITTYETFVYEQMRTSAHGAFKTISGIVKE